MAAVLRDLLRVLVERHRAARAVYRLFVNLEHHNAPFAASAIAFDAFLSLVPLAAFGGFVMAALHESGDLLIGPILRAPPKPVADLVEESIRRLSGNNAAAIAPVSFAAFLWTSSAGLSTAMNVFETVFRSPPRPWYLRRAVAIVCVIAFIAIVAAVTAVGLGAAWLSRGLGAAAAVVLPTATLVGVLSGFLRIAVRGDLVFRRRRVLPGVGVTLVLWTIVSAAFSFYVSTLSRYTTLYGGLAAVAIFLFWLWLLALALLVGGEVNAQLDGIRDDPGGTPWPRP
jgi:membrane protein